MVAEDTRARRRAVTISRKEMARDLRAERKARAVLAIPDEPEDAPPQRPRCRAECEGGVRPCPWVSCKFNLYLDVGESGSIKLNFPDLEPDQLGESCALDVADRGGIALEEVGALTNLTRERVRQLEAGASARLAEALGEPPPVRPVLRHIQPESSQLGLYAARERKPEVAVVTCDYPDCGKRAVYGATKCQPHHDKLQAALALRERMAAANRTPRRETPVLPSADERPELWTAAAAPAVDVETREDRLDLEVLSSRADSEPDDADQVDPEDDPLWRPPGYQDPDDVDELGEPLERAPTPDDDPSDPLPAAALDDLLESPPEFVPVIVFAPAPAVEPAAAPPVVEPPPPPKPEAPMAEVKLCSVCRDPNKPLRVDNGSGFHAACKGKPAPMATASTSTPETASAAPSGLLAKRRALQAQLDALEAETRARIKALRTEADALEAELDDAPLPDPAG